MMANRQFCCLMDAGVTPTACSRNHVAWSKRETYICEFMCAVKSYSEASMAPLNVWTQSAMLSLHLVRKRAPKIWEFQLRGPQLPIALVRSPGLPLADDKATCHAVRLTLL